jgi:UDP-glucose 4-epimerase
VETAVASLYAELQAAAEISIEPLLAPLRTGELERSCMDPSRAMEVIGWQAQTVLADGLRSTYAALVAEFEAGATGD